ncbi:MAG: hypothetical protein HY924_07795 [Elusimicrobia bacterium]|nr:hypothetical protein [Elusimicrobiota bacterium]
MIRVRRGLALLGCLALLGAFPAAAQVDLDLSEHDVLIDRMRETLQKDPSTVDSLVDRIGKSSIAGLISTNADQEKRAEDIKLWIGENPEQAAQIAVGLARDDAEDDDAFESALMTSHRMSKSAFKLSTELDRTIYGRLKKSSRQTRASKNDEVLKDEQKGELVKTLFEGDGSMSGKVLTFDGPGGGEPPPAPAIAASGFYDNLSSLNMGGYSPQLLAIQSALNNRRVPGAPRLVETGRLDYETLSYPAYQMRYDVAGLDKRLRFERNLSLARLLGKDRSLTASQLQREETGRLLEAEAGGRAPSDPRLAKRLALLGRIRSLLADFDAAAGASKDPAKITRGLLHSLGSKQKEAARWLTVASLEEELSMVESEEGFLSPELLAAIDACPVPDDAKTAYKRRGEDYRKRLSTLKANDAAAIAGLEAPGWEAGVGKVQALLAQNAGLRKDLSRNIRDYTAVPPRLAATRRVLPRWKRLLDDFVRRFLPSSDYALRLKREESESSRLRDVFLKIASGDLEAAHQILTAGF